MQSNRRDELINDPAFPSEYKNETLSYIASGSYGDVYTSVSSSTNERVAIKNVNKIFISSRHTKSTLREIIILSLVNDHPNIIALKHIVAPANPDTFSNIYLIFEYAESDLSKLIYSNQYFDELQVKFILYQILCGIKFLHSANILHRDIKPQNILVNTNCTIKICDFGLSRITKMVKEVIEADLKNDDKKDTNENNSNTNSTNTDINLPVNINSNSNINSNNVNIITSSLKDLNNKITATDKQNPPSQEILTGHVTSRWYRSPELILLNNKYGSAVDMWSIGCIFAELLMMMRESGYEPKNRRPLFPGSSCFPWSTESDIDYSKTTDQLNVIFSVIGTPTMTDASSISNIRSRYYVTSLQTKKAIDLNTCFPKVPQPAIDLLQKMIMFDPNKRISARDAIKHPFLSMVITDIAILIFKKNLTNEKKLSLIRYDEYEVEAESLKRKHIENDKNTDKTASKTNKVELNKQFFEMNRKLIMKEISVYHKTPEKKNETNSNRVSPTQVNSDLNFFRSKKRGDLQPAIPSNPANSNLNQAIRPDNAQNSQAARP